jgi:alpha-acetolactate decarboxylase
MSSIKKQTRYVFGTPEKPSNSLEKRFWEFHKENPHVYALFNRFAMDVVASKRERFAVSPIIERIRWYTAIETRNDAFKINNNFRAYYARLWMRNNPEYENLFSTRELTAKKLNEDV